VNINFDISGILLGCEKKINHIQDKYTADSNSNSLNCRLISCLISPALSQLTRQHVETIFIIFLFAQQNAHQGLQVTTMSMTTKSQNSGLCE